MKFSIVIPTRERPVMASKAVESIYKTTTQKKNIEILFACDNNDKNSQEYVKSLIQQYSRHMDIKLFTRPHSDFLNEDYYNWLARKATGDIVWIFADDLILVAYNWDVTISSQIEMFFKQHPDKILCVNIRDNTPPPSHTLPKFPCFPMFSKETLAAVSWLLPPNVPTWGADYIVYCVYKPIKRMLNIEDKNYINHVSYHTKQVECDSTAKRIGAVFNRLKMIPKHNTDRILTEEVPIYRQQILAYIEKVTTDMIMEKEKRG